MSHSRTFTLQVPVDISEVYEARRHDSIKIAAVESNRVIQSHVIDLSSENPVAMFEFTHRPTELQLVIAAGDASDDDLLLLRTLRVPVAQSDLQGVDITLAPVRIALLFGQITVPGRGQRCRHDLSLRNVGASGGAYAVRVSAYTSTTHIIAAFAPATWTQTNNFPTSVTWRPASGGPIPSGDPLPGAFAIWIQKSSYPNKRVRVEWLAEDRTTICTQVLEVACGDKIVREPVERAEPTVVRERGCRCFSVETPDDEDSNEYAEPDLSVEVGLAVPAGFQQVAVPYTIEVEPPGLYFTRQWDVTVLDELGEEQSVIVPMTDDLNGNATFQLPDAGEYNFYLTVTDPATCISESNRDDEEYSDMDFASYKLESVATQISINGHVDPCDPRKYEFHDATEPPGTNPQWTITDPNQVVTNVTPDSNGIVHYTFPQLNQTYTVCLTTD